MTKLKVLVTGDTRFNVSVGKWWPQDQVEVITLSALDLKAEKDHLDGIGLAFDTLTGPSEDKKRLVQTLDQLLDQDVPLLCSFLHHSATEMASWCQKPQRLFGYHPLHFEDMNVMELSVPLQADSQLVEKVQDLLGQYGKEVETVVDEVGGIFPRTLALIINEAAHTLAEGVASAKDIDIAMKKGTNYPFGPLEWADKIGLEHILWILQGLHRDLGDDRYRPAPLLRKKVLARQLGLATGKGFYRHDLQGNLVQ
ncbi:3-hydroxyacyl-CoA dehydrogenase domain-containing protein [Caldalkalibacillus thermarum TA2.A1]|uniref:3-hydroxyacyl-CoA dehydrogenase domain-containing protein n=1 Tax=Caldalkalibacillus thermarum (strain TA2.A1) TaxID=986075 RepID=F5L9G4_CALTT|nr:3-hydroxyacyl-CoA dehydrogenase family protein [Caldalkalibacillus thermarum]EGL81951.1 3-hydroxyacyl-CoA dehydrogenase domain-containing protein [Caldalkalibacillus thermarum TA2.A1]QZT34476.1 3-hydroxybutyryl-CoA dehydrogenase [Caldalkalibacillus thermarum TA2.A1]